MIKDVQLMIVFVMFGAEWLSSAALTLFTVRQSICFSIPQRFSGKSVGIA